jgi:methylenetetrahydrofolate dehydrogenase (NADP+)/methenyltetrahydrofolate cyclohydrolase
MAIIFDGKDYASKKKLLLLASSDKVRQLGVIPHLATILIGDKPASVMYTNLKKKFIESLGCQVDVYNLPENVKFEEVELLIKTLNDDDTVHGIMIQMPLPEKLKLNQKKIIDTIFTAKDVDGLKEDSKFLHPTSKAVMEILAMGIFETKIDVMTVCVVGASGMVGRPLVKEFKKLGYIVLEADIDTDQSILQGFTLQADAIVSATGVMNLITPEMVNEDSIVIDVGSPHGDISPLVKDKVSFATPVPNGVGPVTITCLAENLILAAQSTIVNSDVDSQKS